MCHLIYIPILFIISHNKMRNYQQKRKNVTSGDAIEVKKHTSTNQHDTKKNNNDDFNPVFHANNEKKTYGSLNNIRSINRDKVSNKRQLTTKKEEHDIETTNQQKSDKENKDQKVIIAEIIKKVNGHDAFFTHQVPPEEFLTAAEAAARLALRLNDTLWQANIVLGAVHCCRWNWEEAEATFKKAGEVGLDEALESPWWAAFLLAGSISNPGGEALVQSGEPMSLSEALRPRPAHRSIREGDLSRHSSTAACDERAGKEKTRRCNGAICAWIVPACYSRSPG